MDGPIAMRMTWIVWSATALLAAGAGGAAAVEPAEVLPLPAARQARAIAGGAAESGAVSILGPDTQPIDLDSALRLAGVQNPEMMLARERVTQAAAERQFAAAQLLPNINFGTNYDDHTGNLQRATGQILAVDRQALYVGAGAVAIGAGTVNIPGVVWNVQVSETIYNYLVARQAVFQQGFALETTRNNLLLQVAVAYEELLRAEEARAVAVKNRDDTHEVARITAAYAQTGQGRKADADRAATELARREYERMQAEGQVLTAAARLSRLLSLDPACRLHPIDQAAVPATIVSAEIPLGELLATALLRRPELKAQQAAIREALLALAGARALPFTPTVLIGYSGGTFGGGSNLSPPAMGDFGDRSDFDAVAYWTLRNLGVGNVALVRQAASRARSQDFQRIALLDQVRDEVAEAYARTRARFAQIATSEQAVRTAQEAYIEDLTRIRGREGLPIEVLDSARLLGQARNDYLNAIIDYNRAELELYVALGQPPAGALARPAAVENVPAPLPEPPRK
jgi:outer membrane protein TolC